jgi:hypothetical protein
MLLDCAEVSPEQQRKTQTNQAPRYKGLPAAYQEVRHNPRPGILVLLTHRVQFAVSLQSEVNNGSVPPRFIAWR